MSWVLIITAVVVAAIDWFTAKPKVGEAQWPRWAKLSCAVVVAGVGVVGLLAGYFDRGAGIAAYKQRNLLAAIEKLNSAYASPFKNREVLDYLGLAHKNIADQAVDGPVAKASYQKALTYLLESRVRYPDSPYAKNAMINIYRRQKNWSDLTPLSRSFESELRAGTLRRDGEQLSDEHRAVFWVTLGNVFADQDYPNRSDEHAVALYDLAQKLDPDNMFLVLNMPPRLIDLARTLPVESAERVELLKKALALSVDGLELDEPRDKVFSVLSVIQILMMENAPPVPIPEYTLSKALQVVSDNPEARADFDIDTWFVLTEAYLQAGEREKAKDAFNQALIYQARFTQEHKNWAKKLWSSVIDANDFPFQQLLGSQ